MDELKIATNFVDLKKTKLPISDTNIIYTVRSLPVQTPPAIF